MPFFFKAKIYVRTAEYVYMCRYVYITQNDYDRHQH